MNDRGIQIRDRGRGRGIEMQGAVNRVGEVNTISQVDIAEKPARLPCCGARAWLYCSRVARAIQRQNGGLLRAQGHDIKLTGKVLIHEAD